MIISVEEFRQQIHGDGGIALVLGCESLTALGIIRCLGEAGIRQLGVSFGARTELAGYSKYTRVMVFPKEWKEDKLVDLLTSGISNPKGAIFCATDSSAIFVDKNREELGDSWHIFGSEMFRTADLMDKSKMISWAEQAGFTLPRTVVIDPDATLPAKDIGSIKPPCILKPTTSLEFGKEAFQVIKKEEDIFPAVDAYVLNYGRCLLQEFVGDATADGMIEVFAYNPKSVDRFFSCTIGKIRQYPFSIGSSSFIKTTSLPGVLGAISRYLSIIDYVGVVDFELKKCGEQVYFLEVNLRCGTPIYLSARAGLNLPQIAYRDILGETVDIPNNVSPSEDIYWLRDENDWRHILEGRLSLRQFIRDVLRADAFAIFSRHDMLPFLQYLNKLIARNARKLVTRKFGFHGKSSTGQ